MTKPQPTTADRVLAACRDYCAIPRGAKVTAETPLTLGAGGALAIEEIFKIQISRREAEEIATVGQLVALVESRVIE